MLLLAALACKKDDSTSTIVAPSIDVSSPAPGAFVDDGELRVVGTVTGLTDVTVNGVPAQQLGSEFDGVIQAERGIVPIEVVGRDRNGNAWTRSWSVIAGDFEEPSGPIEDALLVRINRQGLADIADLVSELLVPADLLADLTYGGYPVFNVFYESVWPLDDTNVDVFLTDLQFDPLVVTASPGDEVLHLDIRLPHLYVQMETWGTIPLLSNTDGDHIVMVAEEVHIAADVAMDVAADGTVSSSLTNVAVQMPGFDISWDYLWDGVDWVVDLFLDLQTLMEDAFVSSLETSVPPLLDAVFGAFNTTFEMPILDRNVEMKMRLSGIDADPDGIALGAHLAVNVPTGRARQVGGWLTSPSGARPNPSRTAPISAAISDDFLNRAMYEMWAGGLVDMKLSTDDGSLDPLMLAPLGAVTGAVTVTAGLPPAVVERDGQFVAQLGEMGLRLDTPGGENGDFLDVVLSGETALDLTIVDNELRLDIGAPDLRFAVADSDWGASNDTITTLLEEQLPIDVILLLLGEVAFPLPEIPNVTIDHATAERDPSGVHTDLEIFLE